MNSFWIRSLKDCFLIIALLQVTLNRMSGQSAGRISASLAESGFQNIRCTTLSGECYVSIENRTFRWETDAISYALDIISSGIDSSLQINLLILKNDIPQKLIRLNKTDWIEFIQGRLDKKAFSDRISVTQKTLAASSKLRSSGINNPGQFRFDLVIYPQLYFESTLQSVRYQTQVNISPALEFSLWKGNQFRGQLIFPVHNSLGYEGDHMRPGLVTVSQDFRITDNIFSSVRIGNFINNNYGISTQLRLYLFSGQWDLEMTGGLVGSSHFIDREWIHSGLEKVTGSLSIACFWSRFNMELRAGFARYVNEDYGLFAFCTRKFNETSIGLYAQAGESGYNGGFYFSVPLPFRRWTDRNPSRIILPSQYGFYYNAGTEYYYGQILRTEPNYIYEERFIWNEAIKNNLVNLKNN